MLELVTYYRSHELTESVLETVMESIKINKNCQNKKINQLILPIFKEFGPASPAMQKYRKIFQRLLN
jgi:thioredoxin-like negative regulator of GroEL